MKIGKVRIAFSVFLSMFLIWQNTQAAVVQRDSILNWQHHRYSLNADYSIASMTTVDDDTENQQFHGKVIENDLFRIVLLN